MKKQTMVMNKLNLDCFSGASPLESVTSINICCVVFRLKWYQKPYPLAIVYPSNIRSTCLELKWLARTQFIQWSLYKKVLKSYAGLNLMEVWYLYLRNIMETLPHRWNHHLHSGFVHQKLWMYDSLSSK